MNPEAKRVMHEAILRRLGPELLEPPYVIDWDTVTTASEYEEPWQYSEYTAGGGDYSVTIQGNFIAYDETRFSEPRFVTWQHFGPEAFGEFVTELFE